MSLRKLSITLFSLIGLLLGGKLGLHVWQLTSTSPALPAITSSSAAADMIIPEASNPSTTSPITAIAAVADHAILEASAQLQTSAPTTISSSDSLAMIASYLIPTANAEASPPRNNIFEDETLGDLRQLKQGLDQRTKALDQREQGLQKAEDQLQRRITELEQLEASIQQRLIDESKIKSKKIKRLTAVYEGMKPDRSAPVIARMDLATVVKIFLLMDEKKVGKILSFLPPEKAVTISQALTRQISSVK